MLSRVTAPRRAARSRSSPDDRKLVDLGDRVDAAAAFKLMGNLFLMALTAGCADMLALAKAMNVPPADAATLFDYFNRGRRSARASSG